MKYKLINKITKEEHLCDKVTIDGFDYYEDKDSYANFGNFITDGKTIEKVIYRNMVTGEYSVYPNERMPMSQHRPIMKWDVVIATNNPNIDIPKVVDEVEILAFKNTVKCGFNNTSYAAHCMQSFIEGYNKSKETHPNSDEDMIEFADYVYRSQFDSEGYTQDKETKELLQLWKEQQFKIVYYE